MFLGATKTEEKLRKYLKNSAVIVLKNAYNKKLQFRTIQPCHGVCKILALMLKRRNNKIEEKGGQRENTRAAVPSLFAHSSNSSHA